MELTKGGELTSRDGTNEGWGIDQQKDLLSDHFVINKYDMILSIILILLKFLRSGSKGFEFLSQTQIF